jgi:hypothetical protein
LKALLFLVFFCIPFVARAQQALTNQDVINLVASGLSPDIIIARIKASGGSYETSPATLKELKNAGVPESVILAMIDSAPTIQKSRPATDTGYDHRAEMILKADTPIEIELAHAVSSADLKAGDPVRFLVANPVLVNGYTLIDRGASATARVVKSEEGKRWGRGAQLTLAIQSVRVADGSKAPLYFNGGKQGDGKPGAPLVVDAATNFLVLPAAPFLGFRKGKPVIIPAGKRYVAFVHGAWPVGVSGLKQPAAIPSPTSRSATPAKRICISVGKIVPCEQEQ